MSNTRAHLHLRPRVAAIALGLNAAPAYSASINVAAGVVDINGADGQCSHRSAACEIGAYEIEETPTAVPTLSHWGLSLMGAMLALFGFLGSKRQTRQSE